LAATEFKPTFAREIMTEPRDLYSAWNGTFAMEWAAKGALQDLTTFWAGAGLDDMVYKDLKGEGWAKYPGPDGKVRIYWAPHVLQVRSTFYNKKLFAKFGLGVPTTWDEYTNILKTLKANGILPIAVGTMGELYGIQPVIDHLIVGHCGIDFATKLSQGKESYKDSRVVAALREFKDFVNVGFVNSDMFATRFDEALRKFGRGEAGMWWRATWGSSCLVGEFGWLDGVDYATFTPPARFSNIPVPDLGYADGWVIPKGSEDPGLAAVFIKTMVGVDAQRAHSIIRGHGVTINKHIMPSEYVAANAPSKAIQLRHYRESGIYSALIYNFTPKFLEDCTTIISDLVTGVIDVPEATNRLEAARRADY
jgi:ABC-type glycerol-3-phosphate transport system substrate-binding protein